MGLNLEIYRELAHVAANGNMLVDTERLISSMDMCYSGNFKVTIVISLVTPGNKVPAESIKY